MTPLRIRRPLAVALLVGGLAAAPLACSLNPPLVEVEYAAPVAGVTRRVAVAPFYPGPALATQRGPKDEQAWAAAALVSRFVAEALAARGVQVIAPNELETAFLGEGEIVPRLDGPAAARVAAKNFGATGVLIGEVRRYRERSGGAVGSEVPSAVSFQVTLFSAPDGARVWSGVFDQVQPSLTADPLLARKYPGSGTRWLSAAELARFGAEKIAESMPQPGAEAPGDV